MWFWDCYVSCYDLFLQNTSMHYLFYTSLSCLDSDIKVIVYSTAEVYRTILKRYEVDLHALLSSVWVANHYSYFILH